MEPVKTIQNERRKEAFFAIGIGLVAFACYIRTLAPDILYGDSGEFQALAYTFGITHTSGYPIYILLGKILGTILPFGTFAYRINLLSALYAAGTLSGIYLLARKLTHNRIGALLGSLAVGLAYSFWSQAVIAEIYTLATLAITWSVFFLWRWQEDPAHNGKWLAASLLVLGLGIHTVVELIVPAVGIFILWTLAARRLPAREGWRSIGWAVAGGAIGAVLFFLVFFISDTLVNPPTSFLNVTLVPSYSLWGVDASALDSFIKRLYHTVIPLQWGGELFSGDPNFMAAELVKYWDALFQRDFTLPILACSLIGWVTAFKRHKRLASFMLIAFLTLVFYVVNYKVSSKFVFYLATYVFLAVMMGVGAGALLDWIRHLLNDNSASRVRMIAFGLLTLALAAVFIAPAAGSRWTALMAGKASFFTDDEYTFPVLNLAEPRTAAAGILGAVPDDAVLLMSWQTLYASAYLANAEQGRTAITFREAAPFPSNGNIPDSLVQEVVAFIQAGRPVYADSMYRNLRQHFNARPVSGSKLFLLTLR